MRVICSWCLCQISALDGPDCHVSHGICMDCSQKVAVGVKELNRIVEQRLQELRG